MTESTERRKQQSIKNINSLTTRNIKFTFVDTENRKGALPTILRNLSIEQNNSYSIHNKSPLKVNQRNPHQTEVILQSMHNAIKRGKTNSLSLIKEEAAASSNNKEIYGDTQQRNYVYIKKQLAQLSSGLQHKSPRKPIKLPEDMNLIIRKSRNRSLQNQYTQNHQFNRTQMKNRLTESMLLKSFNILPLQQQQQHQKPVLKVTAQDKYQSLFQRKRNKSEMGIQTSSGVKYYHSQRIQLQDYSHMNNNKQQEMLNTQEAYNLNEKHHNFTNTSYTQGFLGNVPYKKQANGNIQLEQLSKKKVDQNTTTSEAYQDLNNFFTNGLQVEIKMKPKLDDQQEKLSELQDDENYIFHNRKPKKLNSIELGDAANTSINFKPYASSFLYQPEEIPPPQLNYFGVPKTQRNAYQLVLEKKKRSKDFQNKISKIYGDIEYAIKFENDLYRI